MNTNKKLRRQRKEFFNLLKIDHENECFKNDFYDLFKGYSNSYKVKKDTYNSLFYEKGHVKDTFRLISKREKWNEKSKIITFLDVCEENCKIDYDLKRMIFYPSLLSLAAALITIIITRFITNSFLIAIHPTLANYLQLELN
ncbi:MAG: hypothetical protein FWD90_00935 [Defluviitaleaceae bacterium]|nr:hypothetical protein [Defluviitaleaceae bacterium]